MMLPLVRKTIVKKMSSQYILVTEKTMRVQRVRLRPDPGHSLYHKALKGNLKQSSFLSKIIRSPERILDIKGSRKINLALYLAFIKIADASDLQSLKPARCTHRQRMLHGLLAFRSWVWNKLLLRHPESFMELHEYLQIGDARHGKCMRRSCFRTLGYGSELVHLLRHPREWYSGDVPRIVALHRDFCDAHGSSYISRFGREYAEMIERVLVDSTLGKIASGSPLFPEICLYNDYLLARDDIDFFDWGLFKRRFTTLNERGVRDYVKRKLEEKAYE